MKTLFTQFKNILNNYGLSYFKRYYSFYMAVVTDNQDPDTLHRVQARCPSVWGGEAPDKWIQPLGLPSRQDGGQVWIPDVDDKIFLIFEEGDPSFPYYLYGNYSSGQMPAPARESYPMTRGSYCDDGTYMQYNREGQELSGAIVDFCTYTVNADEAKITYGDTVITSTKDAVIIEHPEGVVTVSGGGFSLKDKAGTELGDLWKDTLDAITKLQVPTAMGPSGTPINAPAFQAVIQKLGKFFP